ncbi:MAG: primosomal protein N' [Cellulomonadaceae bacterium]
MTRQVGEQEALPGLAGPAAVPVPNTIVPARTDPVAQVCVDVEPLHLDRPFDYLVPESMSETARPGTRVKVRFGGRDTSGVVLARTTSSAHTGTLSPLRRAVSAEVVLTPAVAALCRAVADFYAGSLADVVRLAVPPRHARTEAQVLATGDTATAPGAEDQGRPWADYPGGEAFLRRIQSGEAPRAVWSALPGQWRDGSGPIPADGWEQCLAYAVRAAWSAGRGALVVLPDRRDVERLEQALAALGLRPYDRTGGHVVRLSAEDGPAQRYRGFLALLRGHARVAVGTRAAAFAPVTDLGLVVCWDDGDPMHAEPRAPYPHVRQVLALRSELEGCAYLVGSVARTVESQALLASHWARELVASRAVVRARTPRVRVLDATELAAQGAAAAARVPTPAWRLIQDALAHGPVLVQVPRAGYVPVVACARCRTPARCSECHGPLGVPRPGREPQCAWCGRLAGGWRCAECGAAGLRAVRVGSERTAEELGRAFPGYPVKVSGARTDVGVLPEVSARPALVVATPGAEPPADGGYRAAVLLDAQVLAADAGLHAAQNALQHWFSAAQLVRSAPAGGQVTLVGDVGAALSGALVRWDPAGHAERDLDERRELGLPPAVRAAAVSGDGPAVGALLSHLRLGEGWRVLGPVPDPGAGGDERLAGTGTERQRAVVTAPRAHGRDLALALRAAAAVRSARREGGQATVRMDPVNLL